MHLCLQQPDIFYLIVKEVHNRRSGSYVLGDLRALALTCVDFKEVPLDYLWHTQHTLVPLLKILTLPYDQGEKASCNWQEIDDDQVISAYACRRFSSYARRIKRIVYMPESGERHDINHDLSRLLYISQKVKDEIPGPLFPNLRHLEFLSVMPWTSMPCIILLLESPITTISMYWGDLNNTQSEVFFGLLSRLGLDLEIMELVPTSFLPAPIDPNRQSIFEESPEPISLSLIISHSRLPALRSLSCGSSSLTRKALSFLASSQILYKLQTSNSSQDITAAITVPFEAPVAPFAGLQHLELFENNFRDFITLIQSVGLSLRNLIIHYTAIPAASTLQDLLSAYSERQFHDSLQEFSLKHTPADPLAVLQFMFRMDTIVEGCTLKPLLLFPNLTVVEIDVPCVFDLRDKDIQDMSKSWPRLRRLQLGHKIGWGLNPPSVTLVGIFDLLANCPHLEHLGVPFNARNDLPNVSASTPINENITYLYVGNGLAPDNEAQQVALGMLLGHVFPKICGVGGQWMYVTVVGRARIEWDVVIASFRCR